LAQKTIQKGELAKRLAELTAPVENLEEGLFASATYDGDLRLAILKLYDEKRERFWLWRDNTGHRPYCVEGDTLLLGDNKTIAEVGIGDHVLGMSGHVTVSARTKRYYRGKMLRIKASGILPFRITPEHPILVARSKEPGHARIAGFEEPTWKLPSDLKPKHAGATGDYLVLPAAKARSNVVRLSLSSYSKMRSGWLKVRELPLDEDTAWFLGAYTAEGSSGGRRGAVFSLNKSERSFQDRICKIGMKMGFGAYKSRNGPNSVNVHVGGIVLARAMQDWCGRLAPNKRIPDFILFHPNLKILRSFLRGYVRGDGLIGTTKGRRQKSVTESQLVTSTSKLLVLQLQQAYARLGVFAGIKIQHKRGPYIIEGRRVQQSEAYTLGFVKKPKHTRARRVGSHFYVPIRSVERANRSAQVYNVQTTDGTYLVSNVIVHNCYTRISSDELSGIKARKDVISIVDEEKLDLLNDAKTTLRKIIATDPLAIGGGNDSIRDAIKAWEADIKYYENYTYDRGLKMGTYYRVSGGKVSAVKHPVPENVARSLDSLLKKNPPAFAPYLKEWAELLGEPLLEFKRVAMDIEVANEEGRMPDPEEPTQPVISVAFYNEKERLVCALKKDGREPKHPGYDLDLYESEPDLLRAVFAKMMDYPVIVTFNGDNFDLRYLKHRADRLNITEDEDPIELQRVESSVKHGVHIDLYNFFKNRSIQVYAFSNRYSDYTLNTIAESLLGKSKIEFEGNIGDLPLEELAKYNLNDSQLTYELTSTGGSVVMKLLLVISRIAKMPMNDVGRLGVSNWIRSMLFFEHRKMGALIPRQDELSEKGGASSEAIIKGKKYKGGLVIEPKPGVYFDVSVLDFASLYPSLIKVHNLSYETVNCPHEECKANKVPETDSWVCKKRSGITSLVVGSLRDLRVGHYKPLAKDPSLPKNDRELYNVVTQGLKIFLNASYGVMGFPTFALYCLPVAEATAALGRYSITKTIAKAKDLGMAVIYSDTDSLYLQNPTKEQVGLIIRWAETDLGIELDLDKTYRYVAFSSRKKNYFGVLPDGTPDIKGLTGRKSQTPEYLKQTFYKALEILSSVKSPDDFERARANIRELLTEMTKSLKGRKVPVADLAFNVMMGKPTSKYNGTTPQHVRAAQALEERGREIKAGDIIGYVKTKSPPYVKPVELAKADDIDPDKYIEYAHSMFDQMLDALDFSFDEIMGATTLDLFWGS
jgi:DNA polymerase, archaea type